MARKKVNFVAYQANRKQEYIWLWMRAKDLFSGTHDGYTIEHPGFLFGMLSQEQ